MSWVSPPRCSVFSFTPAGWLSKGTKVGSQREANALVKEKKAEQTESAASLGILPREQLGTVSGLE